MYTDNSPLTITNTDQPITPEPTNVEGLTPQDENINNGVSPPSSTPCADDMQGYVNKDAAGDEDDSGSPSPLPATIISKEVKPDVGRLSKNNGNNLSTSKDISCCGSTPEGWYLKKYIFGMLFILKIYAEKFFTVCQNYSSVKRYSAFKTCFLHFSSQT